MDCGHLESVDDVDPTEIARDFDLVLLMISSGL
jgi:hypothetical protein